jgi:hypothetical protein
MEGQDRTKLLIDAAKVGAINVVVMYMAQKLYPNNFVMQAFVSSSIIFLGTEMLDLPHWYRV